MEIGMIALNLMDIGMIVMKLMDIGIVALNLMDTGMIALNLMDTLNKAVFFHIFNIRGKFGKKGQNLRQ